ncbi:YbbN family protein [Hymenobacter terrestris]|uniref:Thioredoxin family protein n=1 Tax=Hymenobacter terrestris TaxID=2748310 RepID=A0ABX2Q5I3_9BACT|nr:thioredoxin family protein [Hymenobacter terrestris]NVO86224.1 thioredoxin family protein [Hymenobacter terrestris]
MFPTTILPLLPIHPAMLLVLLPTVGPGTRQETPLARTATNLLLQDLQIQLGTAIHVLKVDEGSHPAVVHAFDGRGVPAFVLLRDGAELWRQQGLPEGQPMAALLLQKLQEATPTAAPAAED